MRRSIKKLIATSCSVAMITSLMAGINVFAEEGQPEKEVIAAFNYVIGADQYTVTEEIDGPVYTFADGSKDLDEYAQSKDETDAKSYVYNATTGVATMTASVNGINSKHIAWSEDDVFATAEGSTMQPVVSASSSNLWSSDAHVAITTSTMDYENIDLQFDLGATKKGPANYKVYYVINGEQHIINDKISLTENKKMTNQRVDLPADLENQEEITLYIGLADVIAINGKNIAGTDSGKFAINNVVLSGVKKEEQKKTMLDLMIKGKEYYNITDGSEIEVESLDVSDIKVLQQNGVDIEGMSSEWSMSTTYLDSQNRGVLEVQVFEEGKDYVIINLVSHYGDCPGATGVNDFQVMLVKLKVPGATICPPEKDDSGNKTDVSKTTSIKTPAVKSGKITSKKISLKLKKKISDAKGYKVRIFTSKKAAKKNKKPVTTLTYKKNKASFSIKLSKKVAKKLKGKKAVYIRVQSYKKTKTKTSKWSKAVKIKKK